MLERMKGFIRDSENFAIETTCSGKSYVRVFQDCKAKGWRISLIYLWVPSPEYSIARVAKRVKSGGHNIPDDLIRRRYWAGLWNMRNLYLPLADDATIYDNRDRALKLVARREPGAELRIHDSGIWSLIKEATQ
jgi:predicted ABC-type ATPase